MKHGKHLIALFLLLCLILPVAGSGEEAQPLGEISGQATAGDLTLSLTLLRDLSDPQINVFAGEEALGESAEKNGDQVTIRLSRALAENEVITVYLSGTDPEGKEISDTIRVQVASLFNHKLRTLRSRVDGMWESWTAVSHLATESTQVVLPTTWKNVPFIAWADEAPEIRVSEEEDRTLIYLPEDDLTDWRVCTGIDIPVVYTDCVWSDKYRAWVCQADFSTVYLISEGGENRISVSVAYERENGFLATNPVLEWIHEDETGTVGFSCTGWGTSRAFQGGMYLVADLQFVVAGEYDSEGVLTCWYDLMHDTVYDPEGNLTSGEEPEGFVPPVIVQ